MCIYLLHQIQNVHTRDDDDDGGGEYRVRCCSIITNTKHTTKEVKEKPTIK